MSFDVMINYVLCFSAEDHKDDKLPTPHHQAPASDMTASNLKADCIIGVGLSFACISGWNLPEPLDIPQGQAEHYSRVLNEHVLVHSDLTLVREETRYAAPGTVSVQAGHLDPLVKLLNIGMQTTTLLTNVELTLEKLQCGDGIANSKSAPDSYLLRSVTTKLGKQNCIPSVFWEVKHSSDSPTNALTQAFAQACNAGLATIREGVDAKDVRISIISSNGREIVFADVAMLEPAFPYLIPLTKILDLCDDNDRAIASQWLYRVKEFAKGVTAVSESRPNLQTSISVTKYHLKPLSQVFQSRCTLDASLRHMFHGLNRLWKNEHTRKYVLFPITIRTGKRGQGALVFENLVRYRIGLPATSDERKSLLVEIRNAIEACHSAGVVHLDFYPSNIMWMPCADGSFDVKIIDWDACHLVGEELLEETKNRLHQRNRLPSDLRANTSLDLDYLSILQDNSDEVILSFCVCLAWFSLFRLRFVRPIRPSSMRRFTNSPNH